MQPTRRSTTAPGDRPYEEIRKDWKAANLSPLWESQLAHKVREGGPAPHHWRWKQIRRWSMTP